MSWEPAAEPSESLTGEFFMNNDGLTFREVWPDGGVHEVVVAGDDGDQWHHRLGEWLLDEVSADDEHIAWVQHNDTTFEYRIHVRRWSAEKVVTLTSEHAPERHLIPQVALSNDRVLYTETRSDGASCVRILELESDAKNDVACDTTGGVSLMWPALDGDVATWVRYVQGKQDETDPPCGTLVVHRLGNGTQTEYGRDCDVFGGVATETFVAWAQARLDNTMLMDVPLRAWDATRERLVDLGTGAAGSLTVCDGWAYWLTEPMGTKDGQAHIRRWRPGSDLEIVYRSPSEDWLVTTEPTCTPTRTSITRAYTGVGPSVSEPLTAPVAP